MCTLYFAFFVFSFHSYHTGNGGNFLGRSGISSYISRDGGLTWEQVKIYFMYVVGVRMYVHMYVCTYVCTYILCNKILAGGSLANVVNQP